MITNGTWSNFDSTGLTGRN